MFSREINGPAALENKRDFEKIMEKYKDKEIVNGIKFHCIQTVAEVLELILE